MANAELRRFFVYDAWANRETLHALERCSPPPPKTVRWLAHVIAAQWLWKARVDGVRPRMTVWPELSLADCAREIEKLAAEWQSFFGSATEAELARGVAYTNSKGESFTSRVEDILLHVVMHGVHHRGQIAAEIRASGGEPMYVDFIHAVRQGHLA
jgi:uncharacterized damage-inducible protein DinB